MIQASHILFDWWNLMAEMYAKYGTPSDIEDKPEWDELQEMQNKLLSYLKEYTGTPKKILFENVEKALQQILGTDEATILSLEEALEIVKLTVSLSLQDEAQVARETGSMN